MSKKDDTEDLLGTPAKKTAAKKAAPATEDLLGTPAKKAAAKKAAPATEPKAGKEPVHFAAGERDAMYEAITAIFKPAKAKPLSSKELAAKLAEQLPKANITVRKLRPVLYALAKREDGPIIIELGASKVLGLTVSRA